MHPQDPDGLLTPKDLKEIEKVKEVIKSDKRNKSSNVENNIISDCEQLQNKLDKKRIELS